MIKRKPQLSRKYSPTPKSKKFTILKEKLKEINSELGITKENEIASLKGKLSSLSLEEKTYNKLLTYINKIKKEGRVLTKKELTESFLKEMGDARR